MTTALSSKQISSSNYSFPVWLRRLTKFTSISTLFLIFAGGMVTSTGSGLSVPDWPLSYGTFFPPMIGGVFYEHGHRMIATFVGLLTLIQTIALAVVEQRKWVKVLGFCSLLAVVLQGVLGGLTVLFYLPVAISSSHAILAQTFLGLTIIIAYSQSMERRQREYEKFEAKGDFLKMILIFIGLIYVQLFLGAFMRHTESGLAIYDFPTMGGEWLPAFDQAMLANINAWRFEHDLPNVTMHQVVAHFLHRVGALLVLTGLWIVLSKGFKYYRQYAPIKKILNLLMFVITIQIILGIVTVLSGKSPILTSIHVATGAFTLGCSVFLFLRSAPLRLEDLKKVLSS